MSSETRDLTSAMKSGNLLEEAEIRYEIIAAVLNPRRTIGLGERPPTGTEIKALSIEADRLMHKIVALRAEKVAADKKGQESSKGATEQAKYGKVIEFDASRYRKQG